VDGCGAADTAWGSVAGVVARVACGVGGTREGEWLVGSALAGGDGVSCNQAQGNRASRS